MLVEFHDYCRNLVIDSEQNIVSGRQEPLTSNGPGPDESET